MLNRNLLYFCSQCKNKSDDGLEELHCDFAHEIKQYKRGQHIAFQNDEVTHLYILTKGKARTEMVSDSGLALPMETLVAPYPMAAAFLFADNNHFPVDVVATENCEVISIAKEEVERQMVHCTGFLRGFLAFNANRMRYLSDRLKLYTHKGIKPKLVYYILSKEKNGVFSLDMSVSALAEHFGIERPSLSRAISEMVRDGLISFQNGKGEILNSDAFIDTVLP